MTDSPGPPHRSRLARLSSRHSEVERVLDETCRGSPGHALSSSHSTCLPIRPARKSRPNSVNHATAPAVMGTGQAIVNIL